LNFLSLYSLGQILGLIKFCILFKVWQKIWTATSCSEFYHDFCNVDVVATLYSSVERIQFIWEKKKICRCVCHKAPGFRQNRPFCNCWSCDPIAPLKTSSCVKVNLRNGKSTLIILVNCKIYNMLSGNNRILFRTENFVQIYRWENILAGGPVNQFCPWKCFLRVFSHINPKASQFTQHIVTYDCHENLLLTPLNSWSSVNGENLTFFTIYSSTYARIRIVYS
jgi:hypothetical protein